MPLKDRILVNVGLAEFRELLDRVRADQELVRLFGGKVLEGLALVGDGEDLRIVPLKSANLSLEQAKAVERALSRVLGV